MYLIFVMYLFFSERYKHSHVPYEIHDLYKYSLYRPYILYIYI